MVLRQPEKPHEIEECPNNHQLQWIASLRPFTNNLGGVCPVVRYMEMSWTKPLDVLCTSIDATTRGVSEWGDWALKVEKR